MVRAGLLLVLLASAWGCGEDRECTFDVDCPIGERCVATRCIPIQLAQLRDASTGQDGGLDATTPVDSGPGLDAGPDAQVNLECNLQLSPEPGVMVATAAGPDEMPLLARSGVGLFGVVVREELGLVAWYLDEAGQTVLEPQDTVDAGTALGEIAVTTAEDGSLLVVWREADDRLHGGLVTDLGTVALGELTEPATGISAPAVARRGSAYAIAWADRIDGTEHISTRSLDDLRLPVGDSVRVSTPGAARLPALADAAGDDVSLAWSDARSGAPQPYHATRRADGTVTGETEVATVQVAGGLAAVSTPFGTFLSWIEPPPLPGQQGQVHVTRIERGEVRDDVIAVGFSLNARTSIAWDGDRLFVAWHRGAGDNAEVTVATVRPDLQRSASLTLNAGTANPTVAADDTLRGIVWIEPMTNAVWFGKLSCE